MPPVHAQSEPPVVVAPEVTGRDALPVTVTGLPGPVALSVTDAAGEVSAWSFPDDSTSPRALAVDLSAPDTGTEPVNGPATVVVTVATTPVHESVVLLDRDPLAPQLSAVATGRGIDLAWGVVGGPGAVTYLLERGAADSTWVALLETADATGHTDFVLAPGSYRYRLSASVAGADGEPNRSALSVASATVAANTDGGGEEEPEPEDRGTPDENAVAKKPPAPRAPDRGRAEPARDPRPAPKVRRVAAAGAEIRAIAERRRPPANVRLRRFQAWAPALGELNVRIGRPRPPAVPRVAAIASSGAVRLPGDNGPAPQLRPDPPVAPALLTVSTEQAPNAHDIAVAVAAGLLLLLACCHAVLRLAPAHPGGGRSPVKK